MKGIKIWMTGCLLSVMLAQVGTAAATKTEMQEAPVMETQDESYRVLPEAAYTQAHWNAFFAEYPQFAGESGTKLADGYELRFLEKDPSTAEVKNGGGKTGVWEIDEMTGAGPVPVGRFAYGQSRHGVNSLATSSIPAETEEKETEAQGTVACEDDLKNTFGWGAPGWIEFERPPIMPYYANFDKQELSASVVNGSTLRISLDIDVEDDSGGDNGRCLYQLGPDGTINTYTGQLKFPWLVVVNLFCNSSGS